MKILFTLLGILIGANARNVLLGISLGGAIGYIFAGFLEITRRLKDLEAEVQNLRSRLDQGWTPLGTTAPFPLKEAPLQAAQPSSETDLKPLPEDELSVKPEEWETEPAPSHKTGQEELPPGIAPYPSRKTPRGTNRIPWQIFQRFLSGENLVVKVGVFILFFGVAFLLKYAAENDWLSIELRLMATALGAVGLLIVGWRLRSRRRTYAMVLQGGGVGVMYITVFAALRLYSLLPAPLAFGILAAVGGLAGALAVLQDSRALAVLGIVGGFLAPVLASTGHGSHVILFSYYALLNACIFGMAWFKAWRMVNVVGFVFTFSLGTAWGYRAYQPQYFESVEPFLLLFFLFYVAVAVLFALRQPPELKGYVDGTLVFGTPAVTFALQTLLVGQYAYGAAWSAFALGFFYLATASFLFWKNPRYMRMLTESFLAIGVAFATLTIPLALDNRWTSAAWALEGAAMVWVGVRQKRILPRISGMLLQFFAGLLFYKAFAGATGQLPILNGFYMGCLTVSFSGLFTGFCLNRYRANLRTWESGLDIAMAIWGLFWWFGGGLNEIDRHIPHGHRFGAAIVFLALSCMICDDFRRRLAWPFLRIPALSLPIVLFTTAIAMSLELSHPFIKSGWMAWPLALAGCYLILKRNEGWHPEVTLPLHGVTLWLLGLLATWEMIWQMNHWIDGAETWKTIAWVMAPSLLVLFTSRWGEKLSWPVGKHLEIYLTLGIGPIALYVWAWTVLANLFNRGDPWPLSYIPFLNPLDVTVAFVFLTLFIWLLKIRSLAWPPLFKIRTRLPKYLIHSLWGASIFLWLNAVLVRTIHYWGGVGFSFQAMQRSMLFQTSLSIFWTLTALIIMVFSTRRALRNFWLTGGGLLAVVVVKLFLIDLSKTGTVERIISFIVVGILLLITGYFSPVPPNKPKEEDRQNREN
ncbi:DUF2339 domain-containing protein [Desulforhabdus amnigena]|uniref:Membrane protein n=1 Tax=Desulforhabdus amnigena TaxID=40218 RepID=A0A9W6D0Q2_9BACT|nr:DUF2339 domain-containing protein [Desulforhabdus amnigena]NLJ27978.1 DUF2339 domain-containing protein [Deltaproteobacteria bacterium]GLI33735.1 membrane protein [Desulforhabdus amnigena]